MKRTVKTAYRRQISNSMAQRQLLVNCLPILGTGLLLYWLSGGGFPEPWRLLVQVCLQFSAFWEKQGATVFVALFILLVQSLLIGMSWGVIIWLAVREGRKYFALRSGTEMKVEITTSMASLLLPSQVQQSASQQQESVSIHQIQSQSWSEERFEHAMISPPFSDQSASLEKLLGNPFDDVSPFQLQTNTPLEQLPLLEQKRHERITHKKRTKPREEVWPVEEGKQPKFVEEEQLEEIVSPDHVQDLVSTQRKADTQQHNAQEQESSIEEQQPETEAGNFPDLLKELGFVWQPETPDNDSAAEAQVSEEKLLQPDSSLKNPFEEDTPHPDRSGSVHVLQDPFDVKQEVLDIFAATRSPAKPPKKRNQPRPTDTALTELIQNDDLGEEFVYGHPFEGPLPDVYDHDEDLKRSLMEQVAEELKEQAEKGKQANTETPPNENKKKYKRSPRKKIE